MRGMETDYMISGLTKKHTENGHQKDKKTNKQRAESVKFPNQSPS